MLTGRLFVLGIAAVLTLRSEAGAQWGEVPPPGRLMDIGGYRIHLWCTGPSGQRGPTVVLSAGGGDFATDWSLVQLPLSDSTRVCSYDRAGFGWSEPGPYPRTFRQEAFELRRVLDVAGERPPFLLVGHSLGSFVVRIIAKDHPAGVQGVVLLGPTNENGKLGYRGQWTIPRTHATNRPVPAPRGLAESPPSPMPGADAESCRARAEANARIWRPYDQLRAPAQRSRVWLLAHPACVAWQDDYFAEEMAIFYRQWDDDPHPLGDVPLLVVRGARPGPPPPGLSEEELRSDSLRLDLSRLSSRGRAIDDSLSGHHVHLDNPRLVVNLIRQLLHERRE